MAVVTFVLRLIGLLVTVPVDLVLGRRRKTYVGTALIAAPRAVVWDVLTRERVVFDGISPIEITQRLRPGTTDIMDAEIRLGDQVFHLAFRQIAVQPIELMVSEVLRDGTDPAMYLGSEYRIITRLDEAGSGTRLELGYSVVHDSLVGRFRLPLGIDGSLGRIRRLSERLAGTAAPQTRAPVQAAVLTGLVTLASFWWLFDLTFAALLLVVLLLHELGHVLAMRWCGLPVRGIYFIPFMGAVAVGGRGYADQATRGFVAVMGPAASMLPTAAFLFALDATEDALWFDLAMISVVLNMLNLMPVLPLDGGQVLGALMSRLDASLQRLVEMCLVTIAAGAAALYEMPITALFAGLVLFVLVSRGVRPTTLRPIDGVSGAWLGLSFLATIAFYILAGLSLAATVPPPSLG